MIFALRLLIYCCTKSKILPFKNDSVYLNQPSIKFHQCFCLAFLSSLLSLLISRKKDFLDWIKGLILFFPISWSCKKQQLYFTIYKVEPLKMRKSNYQAEPEALLTKIKFRLQIRKHCVIWKVRYSDSKAKWGWLVHEKYLNTSPNGVLASLNQTIWRSKNTTLKTYNYFGSSEKKKQGIVVQHNEISFLA